MQLSVTPTVSKSHTCTSADQGARKRRSGDTEPDLCDDYHRPLMTQQLAFHRKLECAHCWGKRHGEYHNDHSHYAYGGSCCCRYRLRRVGTLTSTEHGAKRRSVTLICPRHATGAQWWGTTLCTLPITSSLAV